MGYMYIYTVVVEQKKDVSLEVRYRYMVGCNWVLTSSTFVIGINKRNTYNCTSSAFKSGLMMLYIVLTLFDVHII